MTPNEVDEALSRVRQMRALVLDREGFRGFSGVARMAGGAAALAAALLLRHALPAETGAQLAGWAVLLAVGLAANVAALTRWVARERLWERPADLWPAFELVPALAVGAALTVVLVRAGQADLLFGTWMALYGLAHMTLRRCLPFGVFAVGLAYVASGLFCLLWPGIRFADPRPMGVVFGLGELAGGWLLYRRAA